MDPISARVDSIRPLAPRAVSIKLDIGDRKFDYRPGQAIEIDPKQFKALGPEIKELEEKKGFPEMPRAFSLASHPGETLLELGVKVEKKGPYPSLLTPYLTEKLAEGDTLLLTGPIGTFAPPENIPDSIAGCVHVAAGSGVVPMRGIIRHSLAAHMDLRHILFLQNRTAEDIFYREEWDKLEQKHPKFLKVVHVLSRVAEDWPGRRGYIEKETVQAEMDGFLTSAECLAFVCGPNRPGKRPGFMDKFAGNRRKKEPGLLEALGIPPNRTFTEMW